MILNKKICDECGCEQDLTKTYFGPVFKNWQEYLEDNKHGGRVVKHFCTTKCLVDFLMKQKEK